MLQNSDIEKIGMHLHRWSNIYKSKVLFNKLNIKQKEILSSNAEFREKYRGKRCFVIGNGPSVNEVDFEKLNQELVITVNNMVRHENFYKLNSDFHFVADPAYLKLNRRNVGDAELIEKLRLLSECNTTLFMPIQGFSTAKRYGWHKRINIRFFASELYFYDNYREKIDFTKYIPGFQGVIHWAIAFAIYMGCKEIYLLGCDATNIVVDISLFQNRDTQLAYAFDMSKEAADLERKRHRRVSLKTTLCDYGRIVKLFEELYHYCERNGVKMWNCSEESILDCIPKRKIEDILQE